MRSYLPHTETDREEMLRCIGISDLEELVDDVPDDVLASALSLPEPMSEMELRREIAALAPKELPSFRGAGCYQHYIPSVVPALASQSAFVTAYTPYQPEMSQGMLQAIFEYQTMIARLTGLDAANASVYDGATAAAEAMLMSRDATKRRKVAVSGALHPDVLGTLRTYAATLSLELSVIEPDADGVTDPGRMETAAEDAACVIAAQPNFFGCLEDIPALADAAHKQGALMVAVVNPLLLGALKRPGDMGADIAVGEGQPLGLPRNFGGPGLGFMAAKSKYLRNLPGRIVGETMDAEGNRAFVLTLQAREQHIRREKASSNICSNQALCALTALIYLSSMGKEGLREAARQCVNKAHYACDGITRIPGMKRRFNAPFAHEFVIDATVDGETVNRHLRKMGIQGGLPLSRVYNGDNGVLYCVTEANSRSQIDALIGALEVL